MRAHFPKNEPVLEFFISFGKNFKTCFSLQIRNKNSEDIKGMLNFCTTYDSKFLTKI